jgi:hypothetical protein
VWQRQSLVRQRVVQYRKAMAEHCTTELCKGRVRFRAELAKGWYRKVKYSKGEVTWCAVT